MHARNIRKEDFKALLQLDKKVYPTDSPVTPRNLNAWYKKYPGFGIVYEEEGQLAGMLVAIPLSPKGLQQLVYGKLIESELTDKLLFDKTRDNGLGIHIYHIERLNERKGFYKTCFKDLANVTKGFLEENNWLQMIGISALCTTPEGIGLFENKLGLKENFYASSEHIMERGNEKIIAREREIKSRESEGYKVIVRCKMLTAISFDKSPVWNYFAENLLFKTV